MDFGNLSAPVSQLNPRLPANHNKAAHAGASDTINCYITVFEQVRWLAPLVEDVVRLGLRPVLIVNGAELVALSDYLDVTPHHVVWTGYNGGPHHFFQSGMHQYESGLYVVTDSDLDLSGVPGDAVDRLRFALASNPDVAKAGLSLEIDDVPADYRLRETVLAYERQHWTRPTIGGAFESQIDTTFALYDGQRESIRSERFYSAVRLDRPYTARHLPWYVDVANLDGEERHHFERCEGLSMYGQSIGNILRGASS